MVDGLSPLVNASQDQARTELQGFQGQEARGSLQSSLKMGCLAPTLPRPLYPPRVPSAPDPRKQPCCWGRRSELMLQWPPSLFMSLWAQTWIIGPWPLPE